MNETPRLGKYTLVSRIGAGGMAEVFKARLCGLGGFDKQVVIKRIRPDLASNPDFVSMFFDEARVVASLSHPNIVQIYEIDHLDEVPYIVMEYVQGPTLAQLIRAMRMVGPGSYAVAAKVISAIGEALHHAHTATDMEGVPLGIVHRDVSPQNILVSNDGVPKLLDFGVARARGQAHLTNAGTVKGKLAFMAPEQFRTGAEINHRVDLFAAGCCLYYATTFKLPYTGETAGELMRAAAEGRYAKPSELVPDFPKELEAIILWAMAPEAKDRCPDGLALHEALEDYLGHTGQHLTSRLLRTRLLELLPDVPSSQVLSTSTVDKLRSSVAQASPCAEPTGTRSSLRELAPALSTVSLDWSAVEGRDGQVPREAPAQPDEEVWPSDRDEAGKSSQQGQMIWPGDEGRPGVPDEGLQISASAGRDEPVSQSQILDLVDLEVLPVHNPRPPSLLPSIAVGVALLCALIFWPERQRDPASRRLWAGGDEEQQDPRSPTPSRTAIWDVVARGRPPEAEVPSICRSRIAPLDWRAQAMAAVSTRPSRSREMDACSASTRVLAARSELIPRPLLFEESMAERRPEPVPARVEDSSGDAPPVLIARAPIVRHGIVPARKRSQRVRGQPAAVQHVSPILAPPAGAASADAEDVPPEEDEPEEAPRGMALAPVAVEALFETPPVPPQQPAPVPVALARRAVEEPAAPPKAERIELACPDDARPRGAAPPRGQELWCELPGGVRHGPYLRFFANGARELKGEYRNGKKQGRWTEYYQVGGEREWTEWRRGVKSW